VKQKTKEFVSGGQFCYPGPPETVGGDAGLFVDSTAGVWKHAVSGLHTMEDQGGAPAVAPPLGVDPVFTRISSAAAAGLRTYTGVLDAGVAIDGSPARPRARIECVLSAEGDVSRVADLIECSLLEQIEALLGGELATVDVRIRHAGGRPVVRDVQSSAG
jgi:hypothetical protein